MTPESLATLWLKVRKNKVGFSQLKNLQCCINHLNRCIGDMDAEQIKLMGMDVLLGTLTDRNPNTGHPASRQTLVGMRSAANRIFEYDMDLELITRSPARGREVSRYAPCRYCRALTATEQGLIISTLRRARMGTLVMMLAGLRRGELIPLAWDDIDLDGLKVSVTKNAESRNDSRLIVKAGTKTSWGRVADITLDLAFELQKAKIVVWSKYVHLGADGEIHTFISWRHMWGSYITALCKALSAEQISVQEITAHYLRHTYATLLYLSGVDVLTTAKLLGHGNVKATISVYTHLNNLMLFKSVDKLDSYFSSSPFSSYVRGSA